MKRLVVVMFILSMIVSPALAALGTYPLRYDTVTNPRSLERYLRDHIGGLEDATAFNSGADPSGRVYYVDGNKSTAGNGASWDDAFTTLSAALAASHADMAVSSYRKWAARNTIYCIGDTLTEDLVLMAQKTDIIGLGNNNPYDRCAIVGNHIIPSTTATPSCRWYNMQFYGDQAAEVWDVDGQAGLEFHGCLIQANGTATVGLEASECGWLVVDGCEFGSPDGTNFSSSAIEIPNDTTGPTNIQITNNLLYGAIGVNVDETVIAQSIIAYNTIISSGLWIDDESDDFWIFGNKAFTEVDCDTSTAGYDFNLVRALNNTQAASGGTDTWDQVPFIATSE